MADYDSDIEGIPHAEVIPFAVSPANAIQGLLHLARSKAVQQSDVGA